MAYIKGVKEEGCVFCNKLAEKDRRSSLVLGLSPHSMVMLNKYPYNNGHLLIAPKKHAREFSALSDEEYSDLSRILKLSLEIAVQALRPTGFNLGMNLGKCAGAGVEDHLHWHVVPRWEGDTNFMPVVGEVRVIPQYLVESYDHLSVLFRDFLHDNDQDH